MRKPTLLLSLILILSLLTACTPWPDLTGRWETSVDETLCATVLWLNGDGTFLHIQEGRTDEGTWTLKDDTLTLCTGDGGTFSYTLDQPTGRLSMENGLHLIRVEEPD